MHKRVYVLVYSAVVFLLGQEISLNMLSTCSGKFQKPKIAQNSWHGKFVVDRSRSVESGQSQIVCSYYRRYVLSICDGTKL